MFIAYENLKYYRLAWLVFGVGSKLRGKYNTLFIFVTLRSNNNLLFFYW